MQISSSAFKALLIVGALFMAAPAVAQTPAEKPILTITGKINASSPEAGVTFTRAALEALGTVEFETQTPWYKQPVKFEGVSLDGVRVPVLLARIQASTRLAPPQAGH